MSKYAKRIITAVCASALVLGGSLTALASTNNTTSVFYGWLPGGQNDVEFNDFALEKETRTNYFDVEIVYFDGTNCARMWTESTWGKNFSDPNQAVAMGDNRIYYDSVPSVGTTVVLNADNAVYTSDTAWVRGYWTPN